MIVSVDQPADLAIGPAANAGSIGMVDQPFSDRASVLAPRLCVEAHRHRLRQLRLQFGDTFELPNLENVRRLRPLRTVGVGLLCRPYRSNCLTTRRWPTPRTAACRLLDNFYNVERRATSVHRPAEYETLWTTTHSAFQPHNDGLTDGDRSIGTNLGVANRRRARTRNRRSPRELPSHELIKVRSHR